MRESVSNEPLGAANHPLKAEPSRLVFDNIHINDLLLNRRSCPQCLLKLEHCIFEQSVEAQAVGV